MPNEMAIANLAAFRRAHRKSYHSYGPHDLQTVAVWMPDPDPSSPATEHVKPGQEKELEYWLIFIHGGAWRDPKRTMDDFGPAIDHLMTGTPDDDATDDPSSAVHIGGLASINYRLSPYSPPFDSHPHSHHNARHPDHVCDVRAALAFLQHRFGFGSRYVLAGHSAGATLAFQVLMGKAAIEGERARVREAATAAARVGEGEKQEKTEQEKKHGQQQHSLDSATPEAPQAVVGISGIYEFASFGARHGPGYVDFLAGAFGRDQTGWNRAAPTCFAASFADVWPGRRACVLGWSTEDELVDEAEVDGLEAKLRRDGVSCRVVKSTAGKHDFAWSDGQPVAWLIKLALGDILSANG